jgi:hypothetical protein
MNIKYAYNLNFKEKNDDIIEFQNILIKKKNINYLEIPNFLKIDLKSFKYYKIKKIEINNNKFQINDLFKFFDNSKIYIGCIKEIVIVMNCNFENIKHITIIFQYIFINTKFIIKKINKTLNYIDATSVFGKAFQVNKLNENEFLNFFY